MDTMTVSRIKQDRAVASRRPVDCDTKRDPVAHRTVTGRIPDA